MGRTLVFAGNHAQAIAWARGSGASPDEWDYVSSDRWLRGRRTYGVPRVFVGTYWERRDWTRMTEALDFADMFR